MVLAGAFDLTLQLSFTLATAFKMFKNTHVHVQSKVTHIITTISALMQTSGK